MKILKQNRQLELLNISYNKIMETQLECTGEPFSNESWDLTPKNQEIINCLKEFIKYNLHLVSLKMENTGLSPPTIA